MNLTTNPFHGDDTAYLTREVRPSDSGVEGIRFDILGSMECSVLRQRLPLGSPQQQAIIAYLLLHANEIVPTSQILHALWPDGAPSTARKMLRNAVSNIRALLSSHGDHRSIALLTHSPGYLLRIDERHVDLLEFESYGRAGVRAMSQGHLEVASRIFAKALKLWRGEPLGGLRGSVDWPRLTDLREQHLRIQEEYLGVELRLGQHENHLSELTDLVATQPHRQELLRLLMLALHRCGRSDDALDVYHRTTTSCGAGIKHVTALDALERSIRRNDPRLNVIDGREMSIQARTAAARSTVPSRNELSVRHDEPVRREEVVVLTVAIGGLDSADEADLETVAANACSAARERIWSAGGSVSICTGSIVQGVFDAAELSHGEHGHVLCLAKGLCETVGGHGNAQVTARVMIRTATVLIQTRGAVNTFMGSALEQCVYTVRTLPPQRVWMCELTRVRAGIDVSESTWRDGPSMWLSRLRSSVSAGPMSDLVDRDNEMTILHSFLAQTIRRQRGRVVAVLGEAGIGKSQLISAWARSTSASPTPPRVVAATLPPSAGNDEYDRLIRMVSHLSGVEVADSEPTIRDVASRLVRVLDTECPTVLILEGLDLRENATKCFVEAMTQHLHSVPLMVVLTSRSSDVSDLCCATPSLATMTLDKVY